LLTHVRRGDVAKVHSLRRGAAEALELIAHGDKKTSKVVGRRIDELPKIQGAHIGAIVRRGRQPETVNKDGFLVYEHVERVIIPHHDTVIESDDHVVVFCVRKREVTQVEKLFQVGFQFL
jgi:trk system potassium uptake protein TrkA